MKNEKERKNKNSQDSHSHLRSSCFLQVLWRDVTEYFNDLFCLGTSWQKMWMPNSKECPKIWKRLLNTSTHPADLVIPLTLYAKHAPYLIQKCSLWFVVWSGLRMTGVVFQLQQICKILNAHMDSLQWVEQNSGWYLFGFKDFSWTLLDNKNKLTVHYEMFIPAS